MTKDADIEKYRYSGYGIGFDRHGSFSSPGTGLGRNVSIRNEFINKDWQQEKIYFGFG